MKRLARRNGRMTLALCASAILCANILYSQETKKVYGEPKGQMQTRLKANVVNGENGDVYINAKMFSKYDSAVRYSGFSLFAIIRYIDSEFDAEYFTDVVTKGAGVKNSEDAVQYLEGYFKTKGIAYKPVKIKDTLIKKYLEQGIPIAFFIKANDSSIKEYSAVFCSKMEARQNAKTVSDMKNLAIIAKKEARKKYQKISSSTGYNGAPSLGCIMGYNLQSMEYQIAFFAAPEPFWISSDELKKLPICTAAAHTYRAFDF